MYERFFNLTAEPFRLSPDHRFCYNHARYAKAKAYMAYAFMRAEGFVMVTGRPGTGKTTLIGDLVETLADENVAVANLVSTQLAADDLLRMVAFAFGVDAQQMEKSTILQQLTNRFLTLHRECGRALLIVDEAQDLTPKAMEELRLLTNLQQDGKPLLQIFLLGQPELRDLVHSQGLDQVHQRIIAAHHLEALKQDQTRAYVEHRLKVVGWQNDPAISSAVFPIIHLFSEGVPRRINLICSRLFLHCCVEQRHEITVADARTVVEELQEEQLSTRNLLNEELFIAEDLFEEPLPEATLVSATETPASAARGEAQHSNYPTENRPGSRASDDVVLPDKADPAGHSDVAADASANRTMSGSGTSNLEPASVSPPLDSLDVSDDFLSRGNKPRDFQPDSEKKYEVTLRAVTGNGVNTDVWMTLVAALAAVVLLVGIDRFV